MKTNYNNIKSLLLLVVLQIAGLLNAQPGQPVMPSPKAASFGKYLDTPVSYNTGVPDIKIPIYTVTEGDLTLPISLSYHAGGLKVSEPAAWSGLGWNLNAGGMITRTVVGAPDEGHNKGVGCLGYWDENNSFDLLANIPYSPFQGTGVCGNDFCLASRGNLDTAADMFTFNFMGYSGKFWIKPHDKTKPETAEVVMVPQQDLKIKMVSGNENQQLFKGYHFEITDNNGVKYIFGYYDGTSPATGLIYSTHDNETLFPLLRDPYPGEWLLRRVESHDGLSWINLEYEKERYSYHTPTQRRHLRALGSPSVEPKYGNGISYRESRMDVFSPRLKKINNSSNTQQVLFNATTKRIDIEDDTHTTLLNSFQPTGGAKRLDEIEIKDGSFCKKFSFTYDHFQDNSNNKTGIDSKDKRLRLTKLQEKACVGTLNIPAYEFTYSGKDNNNNYLPNRLSKAIDHWGYYNGQYQNDKGLDKLSIPSINEIYKFSNEDFQIEYNEEYFGANEVNRESDEDKMLWGTLKSIKYPTGGIHTYKMEANRAYTTIKIPSKKVADATIACPPGEFTMFSQSYTFTDRDQIDKYKFEFEAWACAPQPLPQVVDLKVKLVNANNNSIVYQQNALSGSTSQSQKGYLNNIFNTSSIPLNTPIKLKLESNYTIGYFRLYDLPKEVLDNYVVGGLRVKNITINDGVSTLNDIVKTYTYDDLEDENKSSGVLYNKPKYWHVGGTAFQSDDTGEIVLVKLFFEHSIVPLTSFEGKHIGYKYVKEVINSADNGYTIYEFDEEVDPSNSFESYPILPRLLDATSGKLISTSHNDSEDKSIELREMVYSKDSYSNSSIMGLVSLDLIPEFISNKVREYYWIGRFNYRTRPVRISSIIEVKDGVTTSKTLEYNDPITEHLAPTAEEIINSDGKTYRTEYEYNFDYGGDIGNSLVDKYIIGKPFKTKDFVDGVQVDGTEIEYSFYNTGGTSTESITNRVYPSKINRYEQTWVDGIIQNGLWETQTEITSYVPNVGRPHKTKTPGWLEETNTWTNQGNIKTWDYGNFNKTINYYPNSTLVQSTTDIDKQSITFTYDALMRLDVISARAGKVKNDYNYSYNPNFVEEISTYDDAGTVNDISNTTKTFFDGLGRDIQIDQVGHKWNNPGTSITVLKEYNNRGLLSKVYEPDDNATITTSDKYVQYTYYPDPLSRIKSITDPMTFKTTNEYGFNATDEVKGYAANTLNKEKVIDADGILTSTYIDKLGRVVATKTSKDSEESITYTNYDDKSRVASIIPPGATLEDAGLIYKYAYDGADNVKSTKLPDKGLMEYKYDARDLQTQMRDANIKAKGKAWLCSQYDDYGRLSIQGFGNEPSSINEILIKNFYDQIDENNPANINPIYLGRLHKYEVNILNGFNAGTSYLTTDFTLDSYGRVIKDNINSNHIGLVESFDYTYDMADNILTNKHKVGNTTATETFQFDNKGRLKTNNFALTGKGIKTIANYSGYSVKDEILTKNIGSAAFNSYLQTVDYQYNANGWLTKINEGSVIGASKNCTAINGTSRNDLFALDIRYNDASLSGHNDRKNGNISEIYWQTVGRAKNAYRFKYDYLNRLKEADHYINTLYEGNYDSNYTYDERGNIIALTRNGLTGNAISCNEKQIDNLTYKYTEGTNKLSNVFDCNGIAEGTHINPIDKKTYVNKYITSDAKTNTSGGNDNTNEIKLIGGTYITLKPGFAYANKNTGNFTATISSDVCPTNSNLTTNGFKGGQSSYRYDTNGNLTYDSQKLLSIAYNHLNLPYKVSKQGGDKIEWLYTADGRKLRKKVTENETISIKNYLDNMEFIESNGTNTLDAAYHSEGRVLNNGDWEYNLKDHLGNVRIVFVEGTDRSGKIVQENHYYPFGMQMNGRWVNNQTEKNDYLYSGKELNTEMGLNWSDYGFRFYDASISRWTSADPLMELAPDITPYRYGFNNPILYTDPDGLFEKRKHAKTYKKKNKIKGKIKRNKNTGKYEIRLKNDGRVYTNSETGNVEYASVALSTGPSIRPNHPNAFENIRNQHVLSALAVDFANDIWLVTQKLNPFDKHTNHLTGGHANNNESVASLVNTMATIVPKIRGLKGVQAILPKGLFKRLNAAQFSKTFKGTALARAKPKIRGFINKHLNKQVIDRAIKQTEGGSLYFGTAKKIESKINKED